MLLVIMTVTLETLSLGVVRERVVLMIGEVRMSLGEPRLGVACYWEWHIVPP